MKKETFQAMTFGAVQTTAPMILKLYNYEASWHMYVNIDHLLVCFVCRTQARFPDEEDASLR